MNRSRAFDAEISAPIDLQPLTDRNVFDSHYVQEIKAIEFQGADKGSFELGLAVTTDDDFLHIIGRDAHSDVIINAASFHGDAKEAEIQLKDKFNGFVPKVSIYLPECSFAMAEDYSCIEFAWHRTNASQAIQGRMVLRLFSPRETYQWWQLQLEPRLKEQETVVKLHDSLRALNTSFSR